MVDVAEKIGRNIQRLRKRTRWTQAVLANVTGIPQGQISSYENGKDIPKIENLAKLANAFSCSVVAIDSRLARVGMSGDELRRCVLDDIDQAILAELEGLPRQAKLQLLARIGELRNSFGLTAPDNDTPKEPGALRP